MSKDHRTPDLCSVCGLPHEGLTGYNHPFSRRTSKKLNLVHRLRQNATSEDCLNDPDPSLLTEAATEIERLRGAIENYFNTTGKWKPERDGYGWRYTLHAALSGEPSPDETTAVPAITLLEKELQADRAYAWSWHCNIAVPIMDQFGCSHESANRSAAELMRHLFQVDVTTFPEWKSFGWNQDKCECGCCLPASGEVCAGCGKRAAEKAEAKS